MNPDEKRNAGLPFSPGYFDHLNINRSAVERRAASLPGRRTVKKEYQAAWLLRAVSCIDLTTLAGDDTAGNVQRLCAKALNPVRQDILDALEFPALTVGAVCVYHNMISDAAKALGNSGLPIAAVSTGFPAGKISLDQKLDEIRKSVEAGASEIDIVISRQLVINNQWEELYREVKLCREACGDAHMKTILATGEIPTLTKVAKASWVSMMAGSDFIKTSTGKESVNATLPVSLVMVRAIRDYYELTGTKVGYKRPGGYRRPNRRSTS
ncbi:MAG: deoxyribose-phosphate aldolase [Leadbetterella sp.]|nr:deoxyribose-phosphate aldolase [Leadbetterella sp.]